MDNSETPGAPEPLDELGPPRVTEVPDRPRLVPRWLIWTTAGLVVVAAAVALIVWRSQASALVDIPNVVGLDITVARSRLAEKGLLLRRGDNRFSSSVPAGGVLAQNPEAGQQVEKGSFVTVVVSAGSESFALPDVVGVPLQLARATLQDKGLVVQVEVVASDRPKNQVVSSTPGAKVTVSAGDTIKLAVSSGGKGVGGLQPADLTGRTFVLDPAPVSEGTTDTPMEIQRRLNSLLEASGATVVVTRAITDVGAPPETRALRATSATSTAVIGLDVASAGPGGLAVTTMKSRTVPSVVYLGSLQLAKALVTSLSAVQPGVKASEIETDPVLPATGSPGARVRLGSAAQPKDVAQFADPAWADSVARSIYAAISKTYGAK